MPVVDPIAILAQVCLVCVEAPVDFQPSPLSEGKRQTRCGSGVQGCGDDVIRRGSWCHEWWIAGRRSAHSRGSTLDQSCFT